MSDNKEPLTRNDEIGDWMDRIVNWCKNIKYIYGPFYTFGIEFFLNGFMRVFLVGWGTWFTGWFTFFNPYARLLKMAKELASTTTKAVLDTAKNNGVKLASMNKRLL
jgi:hypothetical protein